MRRTPAVHSLREYRRRSGGFTLIELLLVIGVIAILTATVLGLLRGAKDRAAVLQARAELLMIGEMLETYRREYGGYPSTAEPPAKLYQALLGRIGPAGAATEGRSSLAGARIRLQDPDHPDDPANCWIDPWGRPYQYVAYTRAISAAPPVDGFVLFSFGARDASESLPGRADVVPELTGERGGAISTSARNAKNIYARP